MKNQPDVGSACSKQRMCGSMRFVITRLLVVAAIAGGARAGEGLIVSPEPGWPQWRGPRRDGISDEKGLLRSWPEGGSELLWEVDGLGKGWSSPIVVGGRLFITGDVGDDLVIFAFETSGKRRAARNCGGRRTARRGGDHFRERGQAALIPRGESTI